MPDDSAKGTKEPRLGRTIIEDLGRGDFFRTISREFGELKEFYLDQDRKKRLGQMGRIKRWIFMSAWLLKSLFLKLTPARRILLLTSFLFLFIRVEAGRGRGEFMGLSLAILLFILMLELKDKLVATSELEAGRTVQRALMPDRKPSVPGWTLWLLTRPANEIGGDLLDFLQVDRNRYGVALGDVAGKGLSAALVMAKLQATLRALAPDYAALSDLGAKINDIFRRDGLPYSFASLVYLELQSDSGHVRLLNAGHMPPIALKGSMIEEMPKGDPALGILPAVTYTEQHIELQKGDLLLVYSDGVTEARNAQGDFFGHQRLVELLPRLAGFSCEQVGERLLAEVDRFVGDAKANDDLSLVVLKRLD